MRLSGMVIFCYIIRCNAVQVTFFRNLWYRNSFTFFKPL